MSHPGEKNLNTFRILFLIKGILDLLLVLVGVIYASMGSFIGEIAERDAAMRGETIPFNPAGVFITIGIVIVLLAVITGVPALMASARFKQRRGRTLILVAAGINCLTGILGILLCVFTVIELQKPDVKALFAENDAA